VFCSVPTYKLGTCNTTCVVLVMEGAVSPQGRVDRPNHSCIEAIAHSSIDENGTMGTQWSRHRARWRREECEQEGGRKEKRSTLHEERAHCQHKLTVTHQRINRPTDRPPNTATRQCTRRTKGDESNVTTFLLSSRALATCNCTSHGWEKRDVGKGRVTTRG
jgi:hypothetical protein